MQLIQDSFEPCLACASNRNGLLHRIVLRLPTHIVDGALIFVAALHEIVARCKQYSNSIYKNAPVHRSRGRVGSIREEQEDESQG